MTARGADACTTPSLPEDRLAMSIGHSQRSAPVEGSMRPGATLWFVGGAALALGLLVYWTERHPTGSVHSAAGCRASCTRWRSACSPLRCSHPARIELGACAFWFAVNLLFEAGQHPQVREPLAETRGAPSAPARSAPARELLPARHLRCRRRRRGSARCGRGALPSESAPPVHGNTIMRPHRSL